MQYAVFRAPLQHEFSLGYEDMWEMLAEDSGDGGAIASQMNM
jgi:hypothetical protein